MSHRENVRMSTDDILISRAFGCFERGLPPGPKAVPKWRAEVIGWALLGVLIVWCLMLGAL